MHVVTNSIFVHESFLCGQKSQKVLLDVFHLFHPLHTEILHKFDEMIKQINIFAMAHKWSPVYWVTIFLTWF